MNSLSKDEMSHDALIESFYTYLLYKSSLSNYRNLVVTSTHPQLYSSSWKRVLFSYLKIDCIEID
jgi:hypothetical protein